MACEENKDTNKNTNDRKWALLVNQGQMCDKKRKKTTIFSKREENKTNISELGILPKTWGR